MTEWQLQVMIFLLGACVGSFLNVCVARWPHDTSVVRPRSRCPGCGHQLAWYENIPLLSWLALRARCGGCSGRISVVYPLTELVVGLGWLAAVTQFGLTFTALRIAVFGTTLLGIALTDAEHYLIPDGFTVFGLAWGILAAGIGTVTGETVPFAGLYDALIGACVGAGAIAITGWIGELALKKEAMGFGDVTLMAVVGAHLGANRTLLTVFVGAVLGAVIFTVVVFPVERIRSKRRGVAFDPPLVPFGVFLAPGAMIALLWGDALIDWYRSGVLGL